MRKDERPTADSLAKLLAAVSEKAGHGNRVRPSTVPKSATWAGGADGGAWIDCNPVGETFDRTVYHERSGEGWKSYPRRRAGRAERGRRRGHASHLVGVAVGRAARVPPRGRRSAAAGRGRRGDVYCRAAAVYHDRVLGHPTAPTGPAIRLAVALLLLASTALALEATGRSSQRQLPGCRVERVASGAEALARWRGHGVRGRVLVWLDRTLPVEPVAEGDARAFAERGALPPGGVEGSFLQLALRSGIARRVIYVVPDDRWEAYAAAARGRPELRPAGRGFVQMLDGVPLVSVAARDRAAAAGERPLVYLSGASRALFGDALVDAATSGCDGADLVLVGP